LTAGSSITTPWAALVSGFAKLSPNLTPTTDSQNVPNPSLQPESTVAYDFGFDHRYSDGTIVSADYFNNTIHNPFVTVASVGPPAANRPGITALITTETINGPLERDYGVELTAQKAPLRGLGYYLTGTEQRAYFDGFNDAFYQALAAQSLAGGTPAGKNPFIALVNGKQLDGTSGFQGQIPYFKAKLEGNWRAKNDAYYAVGTNIVGANNPYGLVHGFNTWYANATWNVAKDFAFSIAGENLTNFNSGSQTGNVVNLGGYAPVGVRWNALLNKMEYGSPSFFPASAVVVPPPNIYFTLTKKI
jgi:outer membrane receptor protein involved in Fe transport